MTTNFKTVTKSTKQRAKYYANDESCYDAYQPNLVLNK